MFVIAAHGNHGGDFRAIVTAEHHHRVVGNAQFVQGLHQLAHDPVHFKDEIPVRACLGLALEWIGRERGQVHGLHGVKQEEGFVRVLTDVAAHKCLALLQEHQVNFLNVEIRRDHALTVVVGIGVLGQIRLVKQAGGGHWDAVAVHIGIEPIGRGAGHSAVELVESAMNRRTRGWSRVVNAIDTLHPVLVDGLAVLVVKGHANVPLAEHGSGVSLCLQHPAKRQAVRLDHAWSAHAGEHATLARSKGHTSGQQRVTRGRTYSTGRVGIGESHALCGQGIEVGRGGLGLGIVTGHVTVAEIVDQDEQDVRFVCADCAGDDEYERKCQRKTSCKLHQCSPVRVNYKHHMPAGSPTRP